MMIMVTGGAASGKSAFAEDTIVRLKAKRRIYLATMIAWDAECRARIEKHKKMRSGKRFDTVECPLDLEQISEQTAHLAESAVLLEDLSNLAANELFRQDGAPDSLEARAQSAFERILRGILRLRDKVHDLVVVTNEIFSDGVTYEAETELYRKLLGDLNCALCEEADEVYEVTCGIPVCLKGKGNRACTVKNDIGVHMILITGGAYQGKTDFALDLKEKQETVSDGNVIFKLNDHIKRLIIEERTAVETRECLRRFLERFVIENPEAIVIADEVGYGVIPVDERDRLWRELCGEAAAFIAAYASVVYRVVAGVPQVLKGDGL